LAYTAFADERAGDQAKEVDNYRDAEPGKILHEMHYGELAHFKLIPHTPYYVTADATPLYLITLHAAWRATGDRALLERLSRNIRRMDRQLWRPRWRRLSGISNTLSSWL
jgi:glycogen debranching enzyme